MTKKMVKLVFHLRMKTSWEVDAVALQKVLAPHMETWSAGTPVRVCLRVYDSINRPIHMLNHYLEDSDTPYRLESINGQDAIHIGYTKSLYAVLRPLTLTELAEQ